MTASPPGGKVKVREIPVKSPWSVEQVFESGREGGREGGGHEMNERDEEGGREVRWMRRMRREVR